MDSATAQLAEPAPSAPQTGDGDAVIVLSALDRLDPEGILDADATDALAYALRRLAGEQQQLLGEFDIPLAARPSRAPSVAGSYLTAPLAAAIAEQFLSKAPSAASTIVAAALTATALRHPLVLRDPSLASLAIEASRGVRQLRRLHDCTLDISKIESVEDVAARLEDLCKPEAGTTNLPPLLRRYLMAAVGLIAAAPTAKLRASKDEAVSEIRPTLPPMAPIGPSQALLARADCEDASEAGNQLAAAPPNARRVAAPGPRRVLDQIENRAVRANAQKIQTGSLFFCGEHVAYDLGQALEATLTNAACSPGTAALGYWSLYSATDPREVSKWPVGVLSDGPSVSRWPMGVWMPALAAPGASLPPRAELYRPAATHSFIPIPESVAGGEAMRRWLDSRADGQTLATDREVQELGAVFAERKSIAGSPISFRRVPKIMHEAMANVGVGASVRDLLLGVPAGGSTEARLSYLALSQRRGEHMAFKGVARISSWLNDGTTPTYEPNVALTRCVGDGRCVTRDTVQARMDELQTLPYRLRRGPRTDKYVRDSFHMFQGVFLEVALWITGARPFDGALDALLHARDYVLLDEKGKPGTVRRESVQSEADETRRSAARLVPLVDTFRDGWLSAWHARRLQVRVHFKLSQELPPFFLISPEGHPKPATYADVLAILPPSELIRNSGRHFFKTELEALDMPHATIDRLMGHWGPGEELGMRCNSQAPAHFTDHERRILADYVTSLKLPSP